MSASLSDKNRRKDDILQRLNPADTFTLAMDEEIRQEGMAGSYGGFALELDQTPDITALQLRINELEQRFPVITASLQQRGKRYYWCRRPQPINIFHQHPCPTDHDAETHQRQTLETVMNRRESRSIVAPLAFHLITSRQQNTFFMRWIHPLCDARSADLILQYLCTDTAEQRALFNQPETESLVNTYLGKQGLWKNIGLFLKAKRHIERIDQYQSILPIHQSGQQPQTVHYTIQRFDTEQTTEIARQARQQVGMGGVTLYYIGCLMRALERINPEIPGEAYCIPYAFNLRKQKILTPMLGNHISALFAQAHRELVRGERSALFKHLKQQYAEAIQNQIDYSFLPVMWLSSWLSLAKHGQHLRQSYQNKTERSSFWFSDIGTPDFSHRTLLGATVTQLFHLCQISSPPALALLSCQYQGRLTLSYNFVAPMIHQAWIDQLHHVMRKELLGE